MECILIFDHTNDIVFSKFNDKFANHIKTFAESQELIEQCSSEIALSNDVLVQIFTPIVASHRITNCQFGNSYVSIKCENLITICFQEFMGYLFMAIGEEDDIFLKKLVDVCVVIVRYLCGPDVYQLKTNEEKSKLTFQLINNWIHMQNNDQAILIEAVEQLVVNADVGGAAIKVLKDSVGKIIAQTESAKVHALILVEHKLFCLYSSQNAKELSSTDILFLTMLSHHDNPPKSTVDISTYQILLSGPDCQPKCLPYIVHIISLFESVSLLYVLETGNSSVSSSIYETFCHLHTMQQVQIQRDKETLQMAFENLDIAVRRLNDSLKKTKNESIEHCFKQLIKKWEVIKKKYQEYLKSGSDDSLLKAETLSLGFLENLKGLFNLTVNNQTIMKSSEQNVRDIALIVKDKLESFETFLRTKNVKNFSLGSYLEEFPGLVHFIYIDRTTHRVTSPTIDLRSKEGLLTKHKVWGMIKFTQKNLHAAGTLSLMWKDTSLNYSYFLWFEDHSGAPLKPSSFSHNNLPLPGILCGNFYEKMKEVCFPKMSPNKINCYELFCIHLGLITASCVLEQTRRLSATVWELRGLLPQAGDFL